MRRYLYSSTSHMPRMKEDGYSMVAALDEYCNGHGHNAMYTRKWRDCSMLTSRETAHDENGALGTYVLIDERFYHLTIGDMSISIE